MTTGDHTRHALTRRDLLAAAAAVPLGRVSTRPQAQAAPAQPGPPPYTLSINIEIMFNRANLSKADRIRFIADHGFTAYSFWSARPDERAAMVKAQQDTGLTCVSLVGTGRAGGTTGFTKPGAADALLTELRDRIEIGKAFGTPDLICFVGEIQDDVPWDVQRKGIVEGLARAGDLAAAANMTFALEPLSVEPNQ
jgi:hydroxypyruvate isomerase